MKSALAKFFDKFDPLLRQFRAEEDAENARRTAEYYRAEGVTPNVASEGQPGKEASHGK